MKSILALVPVLALLTASAACGGDDDDDSADDTTTSGGAASSSSSGGADGGSTSSSSGATSSSSSGGSTSSSGGSGSEACKGFAATGAGIHPTVSDDAPPVAAGGTVADGTYQLSAVTIYDGNEAVTNATAKLTLVVSGTTFKRGFDLNFVLQSATGSDSGTFAVQGTTLVGNADCNDGDVASDGFGIGGDFTAAGETLTILQDAPAVSGGSRIRLDFTKSN